MAPSARAQLTRAFSSLPKRSNDRRDLSFLSLSYFLPCKAWILAFFVPTLIPAFSVAAPVALTEQAPPARLWAGLSVLQGQERFHAAEGGNVARVDLLPRLSLGGARWWPSRLGLWGEANLSVAGTLTLPKEFGGVGLSMGEHQLRGGARARWGPGLWGLELQLGSGLESIWRSLGPQQPTLITSQQRLSPMLTASLLRSISTSLDLSLTGILGRPLVLREEPVDSGSLVGGRWIQLEGVLSWTLTQAWVIALGCTYREGEREFAGFGRRMSGVTEARERGHRVEVGLRLSRLFH
ncbi:MAG: hypothetical protein VYD19_10305 [Myxococcota bacterium]|nr:hypothetical protein [Myxococcota bacterium]